MLCKKEIDPQITMLPCPLCEFPFGCFEKYMITIFINGIYIISECLRNTRSTGKDSPNITS